MSIESRLQDAKHWLHRARKRLWGTKQSIVDVERALKHAKSQDERQRLRKRHTKLIEEYRARKDVRDRLAKKVEHLKKLKNNTGPSKPPASGIGFSVPSRPWNPYNRNVPNWMIPWLDKTYAAGCHFTLLSGVRTKAQSIQLCRDMCGQDSCPGTCAGASSGHNMEANQAYPAGAVDVDVAHASSFESTQFRIGSPLRNYLAYDPNHFSVSGR